MHPVLVRPPSAAAREVSRWAAARPKSVGKRNAAGRRARHALFQLGLRREPNALAVRRLRQLPAARANAAALARPPRRMAARLQGGAGGDVELLRLRQPA